MNGEELYFPASHLETLEHAGRWIHVQKNEIICSAGTIPDFCYYVGSGQISAFEYTVSGGERVYNIIEAGCLFLVPSVIVTHAVTLTFKASRPSELLQIPRNSMYQLISSDSELSADLIYALSSRMLLTMERLRQGGSYTVAQRLCSLLLEKSETQGIDYDGKILLQERLSQQAMANMLQANRVTVARCLKELKDLGLVEVINGYYCIRSTEQLRRHIDFLSTK